MLKRTSVGVAGFLILLGLLLGSMRSQLNHDQSAESGQALFQAKGCSQCHFTESTETKSGPGLKNLFARDELPASGRAATAENVREQLITPYRNMPSFADRLTPEQRKKIIDYLKTI